ncbi:MAG: hypothetical protein QG620_919 [Patescibacteria group bacterium]|nr:hypothetical protein [Patescibacteria group bacterium]
MKKIRVIFLAIVTMSIFLSTLAFSQVNVLSEVDAPWLTKKKAIVVSTSMLPFVEVRKFQDFLKKCGYASVVCEFHSGSKEDLRNFIRTLYGSDNRLEKALFIGNDIPVAVFEAWEVPVAGADPVLLEYPSDLYFMNLTAEFLDIGYGKTVAGNGKFDWWNDKSVDPYKIQVEVSRLPLNLPYIGSPEWILKNMFRKLYAAYDKEKESVPKALIAADDYFDPSGNVYWLKEIFGKRNVVVRSDGDDPEVTGGNIVTKESLLSFLTARRYNLVFLMSHGGFLSNSVYENFHREPQTIAYADYFSVGSLAQIYMLNMCGAGNYLWDNFLAGTLASGENFGLTAVAFSGITKGFLGMADFFPTLAYGGDFGTAYRKYFNKMVEMDASWTFSNLSKMTLVGFKIVNVYLRYPRPELVVQWKKLPPPPPPPPSPEVFSVNTYTVVIKNDGYVPSKRTTVRAYTKKGRADPILVLEKTLARILPGKRRTVSLELENLPAPPFRLIVEVNPMIDGARAFEEEGDYSNNKAVKVIE